MIQQLAVKTEKTFMSCSLLANKSDQAWFIVFFNFSLPYFIEFYLYYIYIYIYLIFILYINVKNKKIQIYLQYIYIKYKELAVK